MVKIFFYKLSIIFLNLIVPGTGLAALGYWRLAIITISVLTTPLVFLCFSRYIFEPTVIQCLLIFIALIYVVSATLCGYLPCKTSAHAQYKKRYHHLTVGLFLLTAVLGTSVGFVYKHQWLGVNVYFIPSMSMFPTLKPGEFILVDTWAYNKQQPQLGNIIVFQHGVRNKHLVKRVSYWPNGELLKGERLKGKQLKSKQPKENLLYVKGDNASASQDSRYFGGIPSHQVIGKVKLILAHYNKTNSNEDDAFSLLLLQPK